MMSQVLMRLLPCRNGGKCNQILLAVIVNIPMISLGMILGWVSPMKALLQSPSGPLGDPLEDHVVAWMASIVFVTSVPMDFVMAFLADRYGRKFCILLTSLSLMVCWFMKLVCMDAWMLILARGIAGIAYAGCLVVIPIYVKEISDNTIRGALGSFLILSQNFGYLVIYVAGDMMSYTMMNMLCFGIPAVHFLLFFVMPETPSYLIKIGKNEEALSVLSWLRCAEETDKLVAEELHQLQMEENESHALDLSLKKIEINKIMVEELRQLEAQENSSKTSNGLISSIVTDKTTFKAFRITLAVMLAQECCGYLVVLMYASLIFERAASSGGGLELSPNKQAIVLGLVQLVGSILASSVVEKTGRKLLLATTSCITGVAMLALGVWFYLTSMNVWLPGWLPISAMCLCIFCDAAGFQPTPYVIMSEMFSFQHRGIVTSICIAACSIADFIQIKSFDPIVEAIGIHSTFWIFAVLCFLGTLYTMLCVPETNGKSVEEIYAVLRVENKTKNIA